MAQQATFIVTRAMPATLPLVRAILIEAAQWLSSRDIPQWSPADFTPEAIAAWQMDGASLLAWQGAEAIGTITISLRAEPLWRHRPGDAGYIAKVAVRRSAAGSGASVALLRAAEGEIAARGRFLARLDCWAGNTALRRFYTAAGYTLVGIVTETEGSESWECALFERALTPGSPASSPAR